MSVEEMLEEVGALVAGVSPWHGCTHWTHLQANTGTAVKAWLQLLNIWIIWRWTADTFWPRRCSSAVEDKMWKFLLISLEILNSFPTFLPIPVLYYYLQHNCCSAASAELRASEMSMRWGFKPTTWWSRACFEGNTAQGGWRWFHMIICTHY